MNQNQFENVSFFFLFDLGRRTYEGLDEEPMMDVDYDDENDNQFDKCDDKNDFPSTNLKRMKQSPRGKI